jgi:deoxyribodipyrimidine photolyase
MNAKKRCKRIVVWFKRDLRIDDNEVLYEASNPCRGDYPYLYFYSKLA